MAKEQEQKQAGAGAADYMMMDWGGTIPSTGLQSETQEQISDVYKQGTIDQAVEEAEATDGDEN